MVKEKHPLGIAIETEACSHPIHHAWDQARPDAKGHCLRDDRILMGSGSINVIINFVIFVIVNEAPKRYLVFSSMTDLDLADTTSATTSYYRKTAHDIISNIHSRRLVCPYISPPYWHVAEDTIVLW